MLSRRISRRDTSICALCQHRLSLRLLPPRHRPFTSTHRLRNDDSASSGPGDSDPNKRRAAFGPVAGDCWGKPIFGHSTSKPRAWIQEGNSLKPTGPFLQRIHKNDLTYAPFEAAVKSKDPDPASRSQITSSPDNANPYGGAQEKRLLGRHDVQAREKLLAKKLAASSQPPKTIEEYHQIKPRWDVDRQLPIERVQRKKPNPANSRDVSGLPRSPATVAPSIHRGNELGSKFDMKYDKEPPRGHIRSGENTFFRRVGRKPEDTPVRSVPARPPRNEISTSPVERRGATVRDSNQQEFVTRSLSNIAQSDSFWTPEPPSQSASSTPADSSGNDADPALSGSASTPPTRRAGGWGVGTSAWGSMASKPTTVLPGVDDTRIPSTSSWDASEEATLSPHTTKTNGGSRRGDNGRYPTSSASFDNTIYSSQTHRADPPNSWPRTNRPENNETGGESNNSWGLLARKQRPEKPNKDDFWAALGGGTAREPAGKKPQRTSVGRSRDPASAKSSSQDPLSAVRDDASSPKASDDWGREFDQLVEYRKRTPSQPTQSEESEAAKESVAVEDENGVQGREQRGKGRDRERAKRLEGFELEDRAEKGRNKRSKRKSRAGRMDDDDEQGYDFDNYQERQRLKAERKAQREAERTDPVPIFLPELITITALAEALKVNPELFLSQLGELGFEGVTLDSLMAGETAALVAQEYGYEPTIDDGASRDLKRRPPPGDPSVLPLRPPVVTIMGHVDHGKTTLLDYLRKSSVAAQEHGGITQHIGAFSVKLSSGKPITFLDTPGHAAFLTMRQRGANVTDIVVLVVAADDSVKPQTIEALKHARASKVPIIVAINKIDKDGARIDQVKNDLAVNGVEIEDFGGDVQVVPVSGKTGQGMSDLEENILTLSEILDHRAEFDGPAEGWILESSLKPVGKAATILVKRGTMRPGDFIAAGLTWAKIRHLRNEAGVDIDEAPPGTPVEILGWKDLPAAGDEVIQAPDENRAKNAVSYREGLREREKDAADHEVIAEARKALSEKRAREKVAAEGKDATEADLPEEEDGTKLVNLIVKGDVHGSVEAVCAAIQEIGNHEVRPRILRSLPGPISESDVEYAATSKSTIVNFATTTPGHIKHTAEKQGVRILDHTVIYHLVDDVKAKLSEHLAPEISSKVLGEAEVLKVFPINVRGRVYKNIAGCRVRNGVVARNSLYRVFRKGEKLFDGKLETLKHIKRDVTEMRKGNECGIGFEEFQELEVGDQIQAYEEVRTERHL